MNKQELFNQIYETLSTDFRSSDKIQSSITALIPALKKEVANNSNEHIESIINIIIDYTLKNGIAISIDTFIDKSDVSNKDFDLFKEIDNQIEIDIYNAIRTSKRPLHL